MKSKDFAYISLRILAIYMFIEAITNFSQVINYSVLSNLFNLKEFGIDSNTVIISLIFGSIAPFILLIIIGVILWIYTDRITNYLIPNNTDSDNEYNKSINLDDLQHVAFSIVGLLIIVFTLPEILRIIPEAMKLNDITYEPTIKQFKTELFFSGLEMVVKLLIGFLLLFGSKGLTGLLKRIRKAGN